MDESSPPKYAMFSLTQRSATTMSKIPLAPPVAGNLTSSLTARARSEAQGSGGRSARCDGPLQLGRRPEAKRPEPIVESDHDGTRPPSGQDRSVKLSARAKLETSAVYVHQHRQPRRQPVRRRLRSGRRINIQSKAVLAHGQLRPSEVGSRQGRLHARVTRRCARWCQLLACSKTRAAQRSRVPRASRVFGAHFSGGCAGRNRLSPVGGSANGTPKKTLPAATPELLLRISPRTSPSGVRTVLLHGVCCRIA